MAGYSKETLVKAKRLRRDMTDAERKLWSALRNSQLNGAKFRRQQPIGPYVADFVCLERRLIVEADGGQHSDISRIVVEPPTSRARAIGCCASGTTSS